MQCCVLNDSDGVCGRLSKCAKDDDPRRRRDRRTGCVLPYIRSGEATHPACGNGNQLCAHTLHGDSSFRVALPFHPTEHTATARFNASAHNPSHRGTVSPLTSAIPFIIGTPNRDTPVPSCSTGTAAAIPHALDRDHHPPIDAIPALLRPCPLDGDTLGRCL